MSKFHDLFQAVLGTVEVTDVAEDWDNLHVPAHISYNAEDLEEYVVGLERELAEERARLDAKCREEKIEVLTEIQSIALAWWIANSYEQILHRGFGETILAEILRNEITSLKGEQRAIDAAGEKKDA